MGTWGAGIFDDDLAMDVRGDYRDRVTAKLSDATAEQEVIARYLPCEPESEPVFWLALALSQHDVGRLSDRVRDTALNLIESGTAEAVFAEFADDDSSLIAARQRALAKAGEKLHGPQPKRKALRKPRPPPTTNYPWAEGGYYGFRGTSCAMVLHVQTVLTVDQLGPAYAGVTHEDFVGEPVFCLLDWFRAELPPKEELSGISYVLRPVGEGAGLPIRFRPMLLKRGQFPADAVHDYGYAAPAPVDRAVADDGGPNWLHFESVLCDYRNG